MLVVEFFGCVLDPESGRWRDADGRDLGTVAPAHAGESELWVLCVADESAARNEVRLTACIARARKHRAAGLGDPQQRRAAAGDVAWDPVDEAWVEVESSAVLVG